MVESVWLEWCGCHLQIGRTVEDMSADYREGLTEFGDSGYVARYLIDGEAICQTALKNFQ
jgi:hypothetical protein